MINENRETRGSLRPTRPDPPAKWGLSTFRCNWVLLIYFRPADSRPSKAMSKAFNAGFQRIAQRRCPAPVGSRLMIAM
jgi:hypothetical protein